MLTSSYRRNLTVLRPLDGCVSILHRLVNMSNLTRQQLRDILAEKGEKPPMGWTRRVVDASGRAHGHQSEQDSIDPEKPPSTISWSPS